MAPLARWSALVICVLLTSCGSTSRRTRPPGPDWLAKEVAQRRSLRSAERGAAPPILLTQAPAGDPYDAPTSDLRARLDRTRVQGLQVRGEESLSAVVDLLRVQTGLPLVVAPAAELRAADAGAVFDLQLDHPISAANALNLITRAAGGGVTWTVRHDVVLVTTVEAARQVANLATFDLRSLTFAQTDFRGPRIDRLRLLDDLEDDEGSSFGGVGESRPRFSEDEILTLVREHVAPGTWDEPGVLLDVGVGVLFVVHSREVQRAVGRFLAGLGAF